MTTGRLLEVHDERVFEASEAEAERAIVVIKRVMEGAAEPAVALTVPLVVEAGRRGTGTRRTEGVNTSQYVPELRRFVIISRGKAMAELTGDQLEFLAAQRIPPSQLFDASGMQKRDYAAAMDEVGAYFAYGVTPCGAAGHQLRTKAGHCIQCDTAKIAYATRHSKEATVYVAHSADVGLVKVGLSSDLDDRLQKLREYAYGGATDWTLQCCAFVKEAGRLEFAVQDRLSAFRVPGQYIRAGRIQGCYELFACDPVIAEEALASIAPVGSVRWP